MLFLGDLYLFKKLNNNGIVVITSKIKNFTDILVLTEMKYLKSGIFFDTRCYNDNFISSVFFQVSYKSSFS